VRYLLGRLELVARQRAKGEHPEVAPVDNLTVEHILPKGKLPPPWRKALAGDLDAHQECRNLLGNQCLLRAKTNRRLAQKPFDVKVKAFAESELLLTRSVSKEPAWSREKINERQARLASLAVQAWQLPPVRNAT